MNLPYLSVFYIWQLPFYLIGLFKIVKEKDYGELRFYTIALLLILPIPAALTRDPFSTIRSLPLVIPLTILISVGLVESYKYLRGYLLDRTIIPRYILNFIEITLLTVIVSYSLTRLYSSMFVLHPYYHAKDWNYGYKELSKTISNLNPNLPVVVDNVRNEPYIELLFFLKFDPKKYQSENFEVTNDEYYTNLRRNTTKKIGNIATRQINWEIDSKFEQYLIGDSLSISEQQIKNNNLKLVSKILYPDKSTAFVVVKTNPRD